jgi:hypothetical protein
MYDNIWTAIKKGGTDFKLRIHRNNFIPIYFEVINYKQREIIFKESALRLQLMLHEELKFRTGKKVLLFQMDKTECWFNVQDKQLIFHFSNSNFEMNFSNDLEFGLIETEIRDKMGFGDDVEFHDNGDRKIQKGELVHELNDIKLVKYDKNMVKKECEIILIDLELYIGKMKCFDGCNKVGIMSHIGKMFGLNNGYIDFYTNFDLGSYRSIHYFGEMNSIKAIYRVNISMKLKDRCITIEISRILDLNNLG